jgi:hypothetical protein
VTHTLHANGFLGRHRIYHTIGCDECGAPAESVHLLPSVSCRDGVRLACRQHDPGGYWLYIDQWATGPDDWNRPGRLYTTRQHLLATKTHGADAVSRIEARLPTWLVEKGRRP